jgi:hypothetical protein
MGIFELHYTCFSLLQRNHDFELRITKSCEVVRVNATKQVQEVVSFGL